MRPEILAEHLGRRAMMVPPVESVMVSRMESIDAWVVTRLMTGERYLVARSEIYHLLEDKQLQSIYEQVAQEQRGWLLFEGWAPKPRVRSGGVIFVQEYPPQ